MLDLLGYTAVISLTLVMVSSLAVYAEGPALRRCIIAGVAAVWAGFTAGAASVGAVAVTEPTPLIGVFVLTPLVVAFLATRVGSIREILRSIPLPVLVILNAGRIAGILFILLEQAGRLAGPFPYSAGWGDVTTGVLAIPVTVALWKPTPKTSRFWTAVFLWNLFGIVDLVMAIFWGATSSAGSPIEMFHYPPGSDAMQYLPWSLIPTAIVPYYLIMHAGVWVKVREEMRKTRNV
jgi:hypothetical protein